MLNIKKIKSLINCEKSNKAEIARALKIPYSTLKSKNENDSWKPDDIELLSDFFNKPLTWFFDREETDLHLVNEPQVVYGCKSCRDKDKIILLLEENLTTMKEKISDLQERLGVVNDREMGKTG